MTGLIKASVVFMVFCNHVVKGCLLGPGLDIANVVEPISIYSLIFVRKILNQHILVFCLV